MHIDTLYSDIAIDDCGVFGHSGTGLVNPTSGSARTPASDLRSKTILASRHPSKLLRYVVFKRALDVFLVVLSSPLVIPAMLFIAAAVRVGSPGPIFFSQRRIHGQRGSFEMLKFRTMCVNSADVLGRYLNDHPEARAEWQRTHKLQNDPRITRTGRFLRQISLDELPQLWNVLSGSMSLVGPRPIVAAEIEKFGDHFANYCAVKPGITGLWQVSGRSKTTYGERVELDSRYVHNWSFGGDVLILFKTISTVIRRDGAY